MSIAGQQLSPAAGGAAPPPKEENAPAATGARSKDWIAGAK
jgi:hypothetical protein